MRDSTVHSSATCRCLLTRLALVFACLSGCADRPDLRRALSAGDLPGVERAIDRMFPDVRQISGAELEAKLQRPGLLLIDVRDPREFEVSHIPGARRADRRELLSLPPDTPIVVYCSVGVRSCELARELGGRGFTNVANLRGSIFRWAVDGRPLARRGQPVALVHPYNGSWSRLLPPELRSAP